MTKAIGKSMRSKQSAGKSFAADLDTARLTLSDQQIEMLRPTYDKLVRMMAKLRRPERVVDAPMALLYIPPQKRNE